MKTLLNNRMIFCFALFLFYVFSFLSDAISGGNLIIAGALLLMIISCGKIRLNKNNYRLFIWIVLFATYTSLSRIWAINASLTVSKSNAMFFIVIAMAVIIFVKYEGLNVATLLKIIMFGGYAVGFYTLIRYGFRGIMVVLQNEQRLNQLLNANTLGMCVSYSLLINFYFILYDKKIGFVDIPIIPMLIIMVATGSRKSILILIGGIFLLFILKNLNNKKALISLTKITSIVLVLSVAFYFFLKLPALSKISDRLQDMLIALQGGGTRRTTDGWLRVQYTKLGMQLFLEHPILGIGLGNSNIYTSMYWGHNHYLHNNYAEMLATLGAVGTILFYGMYLYFLKVFWKYRKLSRDKEYDICLIILILRLIMDYGAVTFYNKDTYIFFLLFWIECIKIKTSPYDILHPISETRPRMIV